MGEDSENFTCLSLSEESPIFIMLSRRLSKLVPGSKPLPLFFFLFLVFRLFFWCKVLWWLLLLLVLVDSSFRIHETVVSSCFCCFRSCFRWCCRWDLRSCFRLWYNRTKCSS